MHVDVAPPKAELFRLSQPGMKGEDKRRQVAWTAAPDRLLEAVLFVWSEIPYTTISLISMLDRPNRIADHPIVAEG
jgi:hypothetical protein